MAKHLFNWLSQEKDKHKILSQGLDIIYYFLIVFFVYVLLNYRFIYPYNSDRKMKTECQKQ